MTSSKRFYLIDDDPLSIAIMEKILSRAGHEVRHSTDSNKALVEIADMRPDCVVTDLMMPGIDGFEICQRLRDAHSEDELKIVVVSGKGYEFDQRRAREVGANGYLVKPVIAASFLEQIERIIEAKIRLDYWGVRGTLPISGRDTLRYGGCTSCVSLTFSDDSLFIFDAGSGIPTIGLWSIRRTK